MGYDTGAGVFGRKTGYSPKAWLQSLKTIERCTLLKVRDVMAAFELITFDLDDTLWDNGPVIRKAVLECYDWLLTRCPDLAAAHDIASLNTLKEHIRRSNPDLTHRVSEVRRVGMRMALEEVGYSAKEARSLAEQAFDVFHHWRHQVELFPDAERVLKRLSVNYTLGVITNGNADVNELGLGHYFKFSVSAEELNLSKPDPLVFEAALEKTGVKPQRALHIGDNLITDVKGAADVGMKTVWFNPDGKTLSQEDTTPDYSITRLHELLDIKAVK